MPKAGGQKTDTGTEGARAQLLQPQGTRDSAGGQSARRVRGRAQGRGVRPRVGDWADLLKLPRMGRHLLQRALRRGALLLELRDCLILLPRLCRERHHCCEARLLRHPVLSSLSLSIASLRLRLLRAACRGPGQRRERVPVAEAHRSVERGVAS